MSEVVIRNETADGKVVTQITQAQIKNHLSLARRLKASATMLYNSLNLGATVEDGDGTAYLATGTEKKPQWRAALLKVGGEKAVSDAKAAALIKPFKRLRVETAAKPAAKKKAKKKAT